jgi:hypothetical protein
MTTARKKLSRLDNSTYDKIDIRIWAVFVERLRTWIFNLSTRRQLLTIDEQYLRDVGLDWNEELLHLELAELNDLGFDLDLIGFTDGELDRLLNLEPGNDDDANQSVPPIVVPEPPRNPVSRRGDLWILGDHRLLCGDSTDRNDVKRLMNGERAILFATDPPYLVDYDGSNHPTRNKDWSASYGNTWDDSSQGVGALRRLHRRRRGRGDRGERRLVLLARLTSPGDARGVLDQGWRLRAPADHLGEGPGCADALALPVEARAVLHGLDQGQSPAQGGRPDTAIDVGVAKLPQGRST